RATPSTRRKVAHGRGARTRGAPSPGAAAPPAPTPTPNGEEFPAPGRRREHFPDYSPASGASCAPLVPAKTMRSLYLCTQVGDGADIARGGNTGVYPAPGDSVADGRWRRSSSPERGQDGMRGFMLSCCTLLVVGASACRSAEEGPRGTDGAGSGQPPFLGAGTTGYLPDTVPPDPAGRRAGGSGGTARHVAEPHTGGAPLHAGGSAASAADTVVDPLFPPSGPSAGGV